jgi:DNA (cytosine-5)-methyltransferase 3A
MKIRNVLSLFDGMACGRLALERAKIEFEKYYASEIDNYCITVAKDNFDDIVHLGDVQNWREWEIDEIDLIIGGSPCQGFANQGKHLNFDDPRSKLFFDFVDILNHYKPKFFLLENVLMSRKQWTDIINEYMGVEGVLINSKLVSAQERKRLYWANWDISQPSDKNIGLGDILTSNHDWSASYIAGRKINPLTQKREDSNPDIPYTQALHVKDNGDDKAYCLTTVQKDSIISNKPPKSRIPNAFVDLEMGVDWRYFTLLECERLQTLPEGYTKAVSDNQGFKMIGNGWTVDVIVHIFECLKADHAKSI